MTPPYIDVSKLCAIISVLPHFLLDKGGEWGYTGINK